MAAIAAHEGLYAMNLDHKVAYLNAEIRGFSMDMLLTSEFDIVPIGAQSQTLPTLWWEDRSWAFIDAFTAPSYSIRRLV